MTIQKMGVTLRSVGGKREGNWRGRERTRVDNTEGKSEGTLIAKCLIL